jgi:hypothetical protein
LCALAFSSGCAGAAADTTHPNRDPLSCPKQEEKPPPTNTFDALVIADTHASNPYAEHVLHSDDDIADSYVTQVAIRPPHMDQWGSRIVDWIIEQPVGYDTILHLGDAGNIGCAGELDRLVTVMKEHKKRWFMAPGNHDTLDMGNWGYVASDPAVKTAWNNECAGPQVAGAMDKKRFVEAYRLAQGWTKGSVTTSDEYECSLFATPAGVEAETCLRPDEYGYNSFLLQAVQLKEGVHFVIVDTTQFRKRPDGSDPGGVTGGIDDIQIKKIKEFVDRTPGVIVLGGHHPIDSLDAASRAALSALITASPRIATYISAHTHNSATERMHKSIRGGFLEVSLGAVLDWPMEYQYLSVQPAATETNVSMEFHRVAAELETECTAWAYTRVPNKKTEFYLSYVNGNGKSSYRLLETQMFAKLRREFADRGVRLPADYEQREMFTGATPASLLGEDACPAQSVTQYERCHVIWASYEESKTKLHALGNLKNKLTVWLAKIHVRVGDPKPESAVRIFGKNDRVKTVTKKWTVRL